MVAAFPCVARRTTRTELLRDAYIHGSYLTIDRWSSEEDYRAFRKEQDAAYEAIDRDCDALTARESRIGAYTR